MLRTWVFDAVAQDSVLVLDLERVDSTITVIVR